MIKNPKVAVFVKYTDREREPYAWLFLDTIKIGFPNWPIHIHIDTACPMFTPPLKDPSFKYFFRDFDPESREHHQFIKGMVESHPGTLVVCDPDMIFYREVESMVDKACLRGWMIPEFQDPYTQARTARRLHTCLLMMRDCPKLVSDLKKCVAVNDKQVPFNPYAPFLFKYNGNSIFYDTCTNLTHAIGGDPFSDEELDRFTHLFCGTWVSKLAEKHDFGKELMAFHKQALQRPESVHGAWRQQLAWFKALA